MAVHRPSATEAERIPSKPKGQWIYCVELAWRDLLHEWKVSCCLVLAMAAVLTPLLVLFGLKFGLIHTMTERLKDDPRNLQVIVKGNNRIDSEFLDALRERPETGFLIPRTRTLSATLHLVAADSRAAPSVDVLPTGPGDPLATPDTRLPMGLHEVLLSHTVAKKLSATRGDEIRGIARRRHDGGLQSLSVPLNVVDVLPETSFARDAALVSLPLLDAIEDYRDQLRVPALGVDQGRDPPSGRRIYAGIRLYAARLEDVAPMAAELREAGFDVVTRARDIETVRALDRTLSFIFAVIASVGFGGYLLSLAASLWGNVDRKRRELAMLRLVGLRRGWVMSFPAIQGMTVACVGSGVSLLLYSSVSTIFNTVLAENLRSNEFISQLPLWSAALAAGTSLACALAASSVAAFRATRIDPADSLRET